MTKEKRLSFVASEYITLKLLWKSSAVNFLHDLCDIQDPRTFLFWKFTVARDNRSIYHTEVRYMYFLNGFIFTLDFIPKSQGNGWRRFEMSLVKNGWCVTLAPSWIFDFVDLVWTDFYFLSWCDWSTDFFVVVVVVLFIHLFTCLFSEIFPASVTVRFGRPV